MIGINPNRQTSNKSVKSLSEILLKHDIYIRKLVWYNDYWKDYFLFMRMNHSFFAIFYGHYLHEYKTWTRILAVITIQPISFVLTILFNQEFASSVNTPSQMIFAFTMNILLAFPTRFIQVIYRQLAMCRCCTFNKRSMYIANN